MVMIVSVDPESAATLKQWYIALIYLSLVIILLLHATCALSGIKCDL